VMGCGGRQATCDGAASGYAEAFAHTPPLCWISCHDPG